jgi:hypothetical protein
MIEELKDTIGQLQEIQKDIYNKKFYKITIGEIEKIKDPVELAETVKCLLTITEVTTALIKKFSGIQYQSIEFRIETERLLQFKQKALQGEELVFYFC